MSNFCVDCVCWVVLAGYLELEWEHEVPGALWGTGCPGWNRLSASSPEYMGVVCPGSLAVWGWSGLRVGWPVAY